MALLYKMPIIVLAALRYVEGNPVRARLVSSHRETTGEKSRLLIDEIPVELPEEH
jgi:hypothetical protein